MQNNPEEKFLTVIEDRVVNATCLAEVIYKAAYAGKIDVSVVGASCDVLREYLNSTLDLVNQQTERE